MISFAGRYLLGAKSAHATLASYHRGHRTVDGASVVVELQRAEYSTPELARIRHEHDLLNQGKLSDRGTLLSYKAPSEGTA